MPLLEIEKIGFERFEEKEMDHAEGDRRLNNRKRWLWRKNGNNSGGRAVIALTAVTVRGVQLTL